MSGLGLTFLRRGGQAHPSAGSDYIRFKDEAVFNLLMSKGISSDGIGITKDDAAKVTTIGTWFQNNKSITSFAEFQYFTGVTSLVMNAFSGCSALTELRLPPSCASLATQAVIDTPVEDMDLSMVQTMGAYCFARTNVSVVDMPNLLSEGGGMFHRCPLLERVVNLGSLQSIGGKMSNFNVMTFAGNPKLKVIDFPVSLTSIGYSVAGDCTSLEKVTIESNIKSIGEYFLYIVQGTTAVHLDLIVKATTPPSIIASSFLMRRSDYTIFVPDSSVDAYKSAWSAFAAKIQPLSSYQG